MNESLLSAVSWFLALEILSLAAFLILRPLLTLLPDRGYGLSKTFGLVLFGYCTWLIPMLGLSAATPLLSRVVFILTIALLFLAARRKRRGGSALIDLPPATVATVELLFAGILIFFTTLRFISPEIFWGEKPMDLSFLHFFIRNEAMPPIDPWSSGNSLRYYYLGTYYFASLAKALALDPAVVFNLSIATLPALLVSGIFSVLLLTIRSRRWAAVAALTGVLMSNAEVAWLTIIESWVYSFTELRPVDFNLFWASTRLLKSPYFAEYPIWSFLFADLHAHVITLPVVMLAIGLALPLAAVPGPLSFSRIAHRVVFGLVWGMLFGMNSWDFIVIGIFCTFLALHRPMVITALRSAGSETALIRHLRELVVDGAIIAAAGFLFIAPFYFTARPDAGFWWNYVTADEFNPIVPIVRHFFVWLLPLIAGLIYAERNSESRSWAAMTLRIAAALAVTATPFVVAERSRFWGHTNHPWPTLIMCAALAGYGALVCWMRPRGGVTTRLIGAAVITALMVLAMTELIFLMDRTNTIFKFYNGVWLLLLIAALSTSRFVVNAFRAASWSSWRKYVRAAACACVFLPMAAGLTGTLINLKAMTFFQRTAQPRMTLQGDQYLQQENPDQAAMIAWLKGNVRGTPVMLEAYGASYQDYSRIVMNTGIPIVLGWDYHVSQRGTSFPEVDQRKRDISRIYTGNDPMEAYELLSKYNVSLIVVSTVERRAYGQEMRAMEELMKFERHPELFPVLFRQGDSAVYTRRDAILANVLRDPVVFGWR